MCLRQYLRSYALPCVLQAQNMDDAANRLDRKEDLSTTEEQERKLLTRFVQEWWTQPRDVHQASLWVQKGDTKMLKLVQSEMLFMVTHMQPYCEEYCNLCAIVILKADEPQRSIDTIYREIMFDQALNGFLASLIWLKKLQELIRPFRVPWNMTFASVDDVPKEHLKEWRYSMDSLPLNMIDAICRYLSFYGHGHTEDPIFYWALEQFEPALFNSKTPIVSKALLSNNNCMIKLLLGSTDLVERLDLRTYYADVLRIRFEDLIEAARTKECWQASKQIMRLAQCVELAAEHQRRLETTISEACLPLITDISPLVMMIQSYVLYAPAPKKSYGAYDWKYLETEIWLRLAVPQIKRDGLDFLEEYCRHCNGNNDCACGVFTPEFTLPTPVATRGTKRKADDEPD